jgi:hypothetical protein
MSIYALILSDYGYIMSMYAFSDTIYIPKALAVMQLVEINQTQL